MRKSISGAEETDGRRNPWEVLQEAETQGWSRLSIAFLPGQTPGSEGIGCLKIFGEEELECLEEPDGGSKRKLCLDAFCRGFKSRFFLAFTRPHLHLRFPSRPLLGLPQPLFLLPSTVVHRVDWIQMIHILKHGHIGTADMCKNCYRHTSSIGTMESKGHRDRLDHETSLRV